MLTKVAKKSVKAGKRVNTKHVDSLIKNYKRQRWVQNSKNLGKEDSLSVWYSLDELMSFMQTAKESGSDGIRLYFGVYDKETTEDPSFEGRQTIVLVATKEKEIEKLYYSIGEVAEIFSVAPSLIRFWESEFELIKPKKNRKGNRQFTKEDIDNVRTIYHLVKEKGFTLQGAKEMLRNDTQAVRDKMEFIDSLKRVRGFLVELRERLHG